MNRGDKKIQLDKRSIRWKSQIPNTNTKTQNIFCCVNENLTTFLYALNRGDKKIEGEKKVLAYVSGIWLIQWVVH